jgi:hypothetical protein
VRHGPPSGAVRWGGGAARRRGRRVPEPEPTSPEAATDQVALLGGMYLLTSAQEPDEDPDDGQAT